MSLGQLALHVATIPGGISRILANDTFEAPQFKQAEAASVPELIPASRRAFDTAGEFLGNLDDARAALSGGGEEWARM